MRPEPLPDEDAQALDAILARRCQRSLKERVLVSRAADILDLTRYPTLPPESSFKLWAAVLSAGLGQVIPWALKQMDGAIPAVSIFSEVGVEPIRQYAAGIELIKPNGVAALAVAPFLVILSQVRSTTSTPTRGSLSWSNSFSRVLLPRHVQ